MKSSNRVSRRFLLRTALLAPLYSVLPASAQTYPAKPIRLMHAGPAGGPLGQMARIVGEHMQGVLGQPMIIEPKGPNLVAVNELTKAAPDGYTLLLATDSIVVEVPHAMRVAYDPLKDVQALADACHSSLVLVAHPDAPYRNLSEFVAWVRTQPRGSVSFGSFGVGSVAHVLGTQLSKDAGIELVHVPYVGVPQALLNVMGGHIQVAFAGEMGMPEMIASNKLRALALTGPTRGKLLPAIPTVREFGFQNLETVVNTNLFAPSGLSPAIQNRIRAALAASFADPETLRRLASIGMTPSPQRSIAEIEAALKAEFERNGPILRAIGVKPN